jgi:hypothetical protein
VRRRRRRRRRRRKKEVWRGAVARSRLHLRHGFFLGRSDRAR